MEYWYSRTESLWYGSWNRHVYRKGKFAADRHSRSTWVNASREQRSLISSSDWPRYFSKSGLLIDSTSSMYLYVKLNWDFIFFSVESNDCINSASYEYRNMSATKGPPFCTPWNADYICWLICVRNFVNRIDRGLVEHFDEPTMNMCSWGFLCIFWILKIRRVKCEANFVSLGSTAKQRYRGMFETQSPETRQVQERLVSTLEHLQVPKCDGTRCPEELASSVDMPHSLQMFYGNPSQLGKKSNSVIRSRSLIGSTIGVMPDQCRVSL